MSQRIKISVLLLSVSLLNALGAACAKESSNKGATTTEPIVKTEPAKPSGDDLTFINDAASDGLAEVELSKIAASKSKNDEIKAFAQKMINDHSKASEDLKKLAAQKQITLPTDLQPQHKELINKLSKLNGAAFDREYVKAMVEAHEKDVMAFNFVSNNAADADIKTFAAKNLPTLITHMRIIKGMADNTGVRLKEADKTGEQIKN